MKPNGDLFIYLAHFAMLAVVLATKLVLAPLVWAGFALMVLFGDVRARAEERLLERAFGAAYREYRARTRRFLPGVY
jgi:protein-S-isoprenylcysteine O-methyltransferase Ste14